MRDFYTRARFVARKPDSSHLMFARQRVRVADGSEDLVTPAHAGLFSAAMALVDKALRADADLCDALVHATKLHVELELDGDGGGGGGEPRLEGNAIVVPVGGERDVRAADLVAVLRKAVAKARKRAR